jgi:hypothetical protein
VICADWHPDDERLLTRYLDPTSDQTLDQHLEWCRPCVRRLSALTQELDLWHHAAADRADAAFDDRRLSLQRRAIQQKLGAVVPARVLPFPVPGHTERHAPLARVAAAVLLAALAGAGVLRVLQMPQSPSPQAAVGGTPSRVVTPARLVRDTSADDAAALEDIDLALLRPRTAVAELRALDEFTPHVRDLVASRR